MPSKSYINSSYLSLWSILTYNYAGEDFLGNAVTNLTKLIQYNVPFKLEMDMYISIVYLTPNKVHCKLFF
jgi:hypothetical protein